MNAGAAAARGDWLWFLHADTRLPPGFLSDLKRQAPTAAWDWGHCRVRLDARGLAYRCIEAGVNARSRALSTPSGDQGLFVRRALFERLGGFPDVPLLEDLVLVDRLRRLGPPLRLPLWLGTSARRWERGGLLRTVLRMWGLRAAFRLGASPQRLAPLYAPIR